MKKYIILFPLILSGCATWIPAAVKEVEPGVHKITTTGNSFASQDKMKTKLDKKADSVCDGAGFQYREKYKTEWKQQKDYSTGVTSNYQQMSIVIECNK